MSLPYLQSFAGIASNQGLTAFDPNFTVVQGTFVGNIGTGAALEPTGGSNDIAYLNSETPAADQYAQMFVDDPLTANGVAGIGPGVRVSADGDGYGAVLTGDGDLFLNLYTNGSYISTLATITSVPMGSLVRLEAEGSTLRVYVDGVLSTTQSDATHASGSLGIIAFSGGGGVSAIGTDWEGGNLGAVSASGAARTYYELLGA